MRFGSLLVWPADGEGVFFYMIKSGEVSVLKNSETVDSTGAPFSEMMEVLRLGPGQYFGEQALLHNHRRLATVRAESDVVCLCLHKDFFLQMFSDLTVCAPAEPVPPCARTRTCATACLADPDIPGHQPHETGGERDLCTERLENDGVTDLCAWFACLSS